ncbi:MAG: L,D-transpeptidase family protein [Methylocapsa sp.]|nr:L,D-transpeptidase family protein [Methylocapsa sp.]
MPHGCYHKELPLGRLHAGNLALACALGRAGISHAKSEGDRATPSGRFRFTGGFFRQDRVARLAWALPMMGLKPSDAWCDDPGSANYNRRIRLPSRAGHEKLWREDRLYDLIAVLDYNIRPRRKPRGSAIFLHCTRPGFAPTEGCLALPIDNLRRLLPRLSRNVVLIIN